ncbi:hypothetical protein RvY_18809 [Ramazzottius varieornatus]|uniref:Uncharacterized protein n=1 Tax=Ramazzottius varieornatus TaxID=947166 RepID=A0A1D1W788_RAMVA|nr:hypothetical protein RvY_18809 [Ramazzottius varieornatus]
MSPADGLPVGVRRKDIGESFGLPAPDFFFFLTVGAPTVGSATLVSFAVVGEGEGGEFSAGPVKSTVVPG